MSQPSRTVADCLRSMFAHQQFDGLGDSVVLRRFVETGDDRAFACLMRRHGPMVWGLARRIVRDHQLAEDVFQATFLVLARKPRTVRSGDRLPAWLHRVAFRLAIRAKKSRRGWLQPAALVAKPAAADPLDELSAREFLTLLDEELNRLPEKYRLPLILCHLEGLSREEAAKRLNSSAGAVKGNLERGRVMLRELLTKRGLDLGPTPDCWADWKSVLLATGLPPSATVVPPALAQATLKAALTRQGASLGAAALAKGMIKMMILARIGSVCLAVALLGTVGWGAGWVALGGSTGKKEEQPGPRQVAAARTPPSKQPKEKRVDLYGDPLPEGAVMRLGTVQLRAAGANLAITPDGKTLVGVQSGNLLSFWDVMSGKLKETRELPVDKSSFNAVLSFDGRLLATEDLEIWDVKTGKAVRKLVSQGDWVECQRREFSPDSKYFAAVRTVHPSKTNGKYKRLVRVWDLATGQEIFATDVDAVSEWSAEILRFTPDGKKLVASFWDGLQCWDIATGRQLWHNKEFRESGAGAAVSPDGSKMFLPYPPKRLAFLFSFRVVDLATGALIKGDRLPPPGERVDGTYQVMVLPDGRTILHSDKDGVVVWDMAAGKEVLRLVGAGADMVLAPDGKTLITNNGALQRWDLTTGKAAYLDNFDQGHTQDVDALVFSGDGKRLASGSLDGSVRLWDVTAGRPIYVWRCYRPDREFHTREGPTALDMTFDGRSIIAAGLGNLRIWDGVTGKDVATIALPELANGEWDQHVFQLRINSKGSLAVGTFGAGLFVPPPVGPEQPRHWLASWDLGKGALVSKHAIPLTHPWTSCLALGGKKLVSWGDVFDIATGKKRLRLERAGKDFLFRPCAASSDSSLFAGSAAQDAMQKPGYRDLLIWEAATGKSIAALKLQSRKRLAFHPSNRYLATADDDGVLIWDIATAKVIATRKMPGNLAFTKLNPSTIGCLAFTPDGRRLVTGHADGTVLFWKIDLPRPKRVRLDSPAVTALWAELQDADAGKAWQAVWHLADAVDDVVPFLRKKLKPVLPASPSTTDRLLKDLGSDVFAKRDAANKRLKELGLSAETALRQRLDSNPPLELRQRIEVLLKAIAETPQPMTPEVLQSLRGVAVLARINSPQARQILEDLAKGVDSAPLTAAAKAALGL